MRVKPCWAGVVRRPLAVYLLTGVAVSSCGKSQPPESPVRDSVVAMVKPIVGNRMPAFTFATLSGDSARVGGADTQPVTLLNMWATWCGPCKKEFPDLQTLHDTYQARGLRVLAVSTDESEVAVKAFVMAAGSHFVIGRDPGNSVLAVLQETGLPQNILLSSDGRILWKSYGIGDPAETGLTTAIESALTPR